MLTILDANKLTQLVMLCNVLIFNYPFSGSIILSHPYTILSRRLYAIQLKRPWIWPACPTLASRLDNGHTTWHGSSRKPEGDSVPKEWIQNCLASMTTIRVMFMMFQCTWILNAMTYMTWNIKNQNIPTIPQVDQLLWFRNRTQKLTKPYQNAVFPATCSSHVLRYQFTSEWLGCLLG